MPVANKLLLIAHENRGGFPGEAPIGDDGMRAAGLVARLMGLESMPVVNQNKPNKGLDSEKLIVGHENSHGNVRTYSRATKTEGFIGRSSKSMMSRDKRQDHHKLPSPVKSPRSPSRTSATRLLQSAATKILEPQVHSRSLARCTITYIDSDNVDGSGAGSSLKNGREAPIGESLVGLQSRESGSDCSNAATAASSNSNGSSVEGKIKTPVTTSRRVRNAKHIVDQAKHNVHSMEKKPGKDVVNSRLALRNEPSKRYESPLVRDKEAHATRPSSRKPIEKARNEQNGAKDFIRLNKNLRECSPTRSPTKVSNNFRVEATRSDWERNSARKKRPSQGRPAEIVGPINTAFSKQAAVRSFSSSINHRKEAAGFIGGSSTNRHGTGRLLTKKADGDSGIKDNGIVSFTFSSPMRHVSTSSGRQEAKVKGKLSGELTRGDSCSRLNSDTNIERMTLRGNQLSNLLEQKIKQLTCLDGENLKTANPLPAKSTATILVELISALTTEDPFHLESGNNFFGVSTLSEDSFLDGDDLSVSTVSQDRMLILKEKFQEEDKTGISASFSVIDSDRPSPVSILEAPFSNDSCSVGSPCSSGGKQHFQSIESFGKRYMLDFEANLVASVTPTYTNELDTEEIPRADDEKPGMHGSCLQKAGFSEAKINSISEVISNAQLLFESTPLFESDVTMRCSVDILLLSILETNLESFQRSLDFGKEEYQLRDLLFDCIIEWFDSKCSLSCCSGYREWLKLHAFLSRGRLLREVNEEIRGWGAYAGRVGDDLIEKEIRVSTPMWTQFEIESFEIGMEIENEILVAVVDEMVADMLLLRVYCSNPLRVYGLIDSSIL